MPSIGSEGQTLKQQCVSGRLKSADALADHQSPYKAEVNYDMTQDPPAPIMDSGIVTKSHAYLPGWIQKYLKNVVEIKFPPDRFDTKQCDAYARIAGDPGKVVVMGPSDCGCSDDQQARPESATSMASQAARLFGQGLKSFMQGGMPPPPIPMPVP
jgi:hypothetical protein